MAAHFAKRLTLVVFTALTLRGLVEGADFQSTLRTALLSMPLFLVIGLVCGEIARRVVEEQVDRDLPRLTSAASPAGLSTPDDELD